MGMTAGLSFICGSVVVGAVALSMGNKRLYDSLFKTRMIAVVSWQTDMPAPGVTGKHLWPAGCRATAAARI